jgi:hypothetical protein
MILKWAGSRRVTHVFCSVATVMSGAPSLHDVDDVSAWKEQSDPPCLLSQHISAQPGRCAGGHSRSLGCARRTARGCSLGVPPSSAHGRAPSKPSPDFADIFSMWPAGGETAR